MLALRGTVDNWWSLALVVTWQLAALAVVAWLCEKAFRLRHPRVKYALWWFVLVAPLVLAPGRISLERREAVLRMAAPEAVVRVVRGSALGTERPPIGSFAQTGPLAAEWEASTTLWWQGLSLTDALAAVWLLECVALTLRLLVGHRRARRMIADSQPVAGEGVLMALEALLSEAGVRREVALRTSASLGAPVLYGLRRPTILLPEDWLDSLSPEDLRALLAHEVAHIKRQDFLTHLLQRLVEIPLFFHPGAWLANRQIALAREELADAWALRNGVDAGSYARSLTVAAERVQTRLSVASVGVAEGRSTLLLRVEAIMRRESIKRLSRPSAAALTAVLLACTGAFAAVQMGSKTEDGDPEDVVADVIEGCEAAASHVSTAAGEVTLHQWYWRESGELLETESHYDVVYAGDRLKVAEEVRYLENQLSMPPDSGPRAQPIAPGTVHKQDLAYDGEKVTSYEPDRQRAVIAGKDSREWGNLLQIRGVVGLPGHGVPSLSTYLPMDRYTRTGPYVVGREIVNGDECVVVETVDTRTDPDGGEVAYWNRSWINPQRGFTASKSTAGARGGVFGEGMLLSEWELTTRSYGDGLWGMSEARTEQYGVDDSGRRYVQMRMVITYADDYQLNVPVTDEILMVELPSGTRVHDKLSDKQYTVP